MLLNNFKLGLQKFGQAAHAAQHTCSHNHIMMPSSFMTSMTRSYKIRTAVKKFCADCYIARRKGRVYVLCKSNPKHKQKQA